MGEVKKIKFTYDPFALVKLALDRFAEEREGQDIKAIQFARYEYLRTLTTNELEDLLQRYVDEEKLEYITLEDWRKDSNYLFTYIYETERYKALEFDFKKKGYGTTGLGVIDTSDNTFYDCAFTEHWPKMREIISQKYPQYNEAFIEMFINEALMEHNGVTRKELDAFINRFELVGETKGLKQYLKS